MGDKLPKYTKNQQIGNRSASILKSVMQRFCIFTELDQSQDLGIDFIGTVINNSYPTAYNFYAQCKGTDIMIFHLLMKNWQIYTMIYVVL